VKESDKGNAFHARIDLFDVFVGDLITKHAEDVALDLAPTALEEPPHGVVLGVLIGRTALPAFAMELPSTLHYIRPSASAQ
jgi:hypothetical protein